MSLQIPSKLLEINVISAQDLPPVSKLLRTFVVAWIEPDHQLTTRVDHKGNTNPTWNYKLVFPIDENLLPLETYTLTIHIYNVAWLRDIPIGAACVPVKNLLQKSGPRPITLYISRPSGLLQGILNIGVNLIDSTVPTIPSYSQLCIATGKSEGSPENHNSTTYSSAKSGGTPVNQTPPSIKLQRSKSERSSSYMDRLSLTRTKSVSIASQSGQLQRQFTASYGSMCSMMMHPLPSEVAAGFHKGVYSTGGNDYGSSIFENWTVAAGTETRADDKSDDDGEKSRLIRWRAVDQIPLMIKDDDYRPIRPKSERRRKSKSDGGGLFSCFGNAYGFEFSIICGNDVKKNRKKMLRKTKTNPQEKLRRFHV